MIGTRYELADLVAELREILASEAPEAERMARGGEALGRLLKNPEALAAFGELPAEPVNYLLHAEPDGGFTVAALVKAPGHGTPVHDHGPSWTLYGVFEGTETIARYERVDDESVAGRAELRVRETIAGHPGLVDVVPPWMPHAERNESGAQTRAIIVRSQPMGTFPQRQYDVPAGTCREVYGGVPVVPPPNAR
jgi:predicted metal-dependent enzyme (double-stranded beta helix superfamily)